MSSESSGHANNVVDDGASSMGSTSRKRAGSRRACTLERKLLSQNRILIAKLRNLARRSLDGDSLSPDEEAELSLHAALVESLTAGLLRGRAARAATIARRAEAPEPSDDVEAKVTRLAQLLSCGRHPRLVVYTGAGVSTTADIPDYRGPNGTWTRLPRGAVPRFSLPGVANARPTFTHRLLAVLAALSAGSLPTHNNPLACSSASSAEPAHNDPLVSAQLTSPTPASVQSRLIRVVSQNCDGLHLRSGVPPQLLSELHGNVFLEICELCGRLVSRRFDVTERTGLRRHVTGRICGSGGGGGSGSVNCSGRLLDTVVHFGEFGRECTRDRVYEWRSAEAAAKQADLILCMGTSLQVLRHYPLLWPKGVPLVIVNLQATPMDRRAMFTIRADCDTVSRNLAARLGISVPEYSPTADPLLVGSEPISEQDRECVTRPDIVA